VQIGPLVDIYRSCPMIHRIVYSFLAGCGGLGIAITAGAYPLLIMEYIFGIEYTWLLVGGIAFISTAITTYVCFTVFSLSLKSVDFSIVAFILLILLVPLFVVVAGLSAEWFALSITRHDRWRGGDFEEYDRFVFCKRMFYVGALLPLVMFGTWFLVRIYKRKISGVHEPDLRELDE